ncbi:MAG TPA: thioesterase family protein [Candidatus Saccharimonadales bacterium]|nr:thioesterase family protein [Candidatus Saccharimonadales bacterium]
MSTIFESTIRVRYAETDQMAVAYNANYLVWFEIGRVELLRQLGFSYQEMEQEGLNLPVVEVKCRYRHPARYDDEIIIRTCIGHLKSYVVRFEYELVRKSDERMLAQGESIHVVTGRDLQRAHLTGKYWNALHAAAEKAEPGAES